MPKTTFSMKTPAFPTCLNPCRWRVLETAKVISRGFMCVVGNVLVFYVCMRAVYLHVRADGVSRWCVYVCVQWMQSVLAGLDSEQ